MKISDRTRIPLLAALKRPPAETAAALDAWLPALLDHAFKGEL